MGEMTARQVIERERECVARQQCDRDCAKCDLVMEADDILAAYDHALDLLEVEEKTGMTPEDAATIGRFREHIFSEWSYARMAEIAKAESEGRLLMLPEGETIKSLAETMNRRRRRAEAERFRPRVFSESLRSYDEGYAAALGYVLHTSLAKEDDKK